MAEIDIDLLRQWIGRRKRCEDRLAPDRAEAVAATLDRGSTPEVGDPLPALWHWALFNPKATLSDLGADGHPKLGGFMPPIPLPRRMWVGGRLRFLAPLGIGEQAAQVTEIRDITAKAGKSGTLVFATLRHEISGASGVAIIEEQDLVYREPTPPARPRSAPEPAHRAAAPEPKPADWRDVHVPGPVQLFRYSAVTFNAHRIHYDAPYAREEEGYPGLVVHGPLTATLLAESLGARQAAPFAEFSFRAMQPLFANQPLTVCGVGRGDGRFELWAETPSGQVAMAAEAALRSRAIPQEPSHA